MSTLKDLHLHGLFTGGIIRTLTLCRMAQQNVTSESKVGGLNQTLKA